jgi:hypothetical protein
MYATRATQIKMYGAPAVQKLQVLLQCDAEAFSMTLKLHLHPLDEVGWKGTGSLGTTIKNGARLLLDLAGV